MLDWPTCPWCWRWPNPGSSSFCSRRRCMRRRSGDQGARRFSRTSCRPCSRGCGRVRCSRAGTTSRRRRCLCLEEHAPRWGPSVLFLATCSSSPGSCSGLSSGSGCWLPWLSEPGLYLGASRRGRRSAALRASLASMPQSCCGGRAASCRAPSRSASAASFGGGSLADLCLSSSTCGRLPPTSLVSRTAFLAHRVRFERS